MTTVWAEILLLSWQDVGELTILGFALSRLFLWLSRDAQVPWVPVVTSYVVVWAALFYMHCAVLWIVMTVLAPLVAVVVLSMHREQLQKYLVTYRKSTDETVSEATLEQLLGALLHGMPSAMIPRTLTCVIERSDDLERLVSVPIRVHAVPQRELVIALMTIAAPEHTFWLIDRAGLLAGINGSWRHVLQGAIDYSELTNRVDCLVFQLHPNRTIDLYMHGNCYPELSVVHALRMMMAYNHAAAE